MSDIVSLIDEAAKKKKPWQKSSVLPKIAPPPSVPGAKKVRAADKSQNGKPAKKGSTVGTGSNAGETGVGGMESGSGSGSTAATYLSPWTEQSRTIYDPYYVTDSSGMFFYIVNPIQSMTLKTADSPAKTIVVNYKDTTPA